MSTSLTNQEFEIQKIPYAGFWQRIAAAFLDFLILIPVGLGVLFLNGIHKDIIFFTFLPTIAFALYYNVYLVKKYGGSPGKLILGIRIIKTNGARVQWTNAIFRYIIDFILGLFTAIIVLFTLSKITASEYEVLSIFERVNHLKSLNPSLFTFSHWLGTIWFWGVFISLLMNKKRRAIHDFIAGTIVVKTKFESSIKSNIEYDQFPILQILGFSIFFITMFSFLALFITNPQAFKELNYIGPLRYNIKGFILQRQVQLLNYIIPGVLVSFFGYTLLKKLKKSSVSFIAPISLIIVGISWLSFGLIEMNPNGNGEAYAFTFLIQIVITRISIIMTLVLITSETLLYSTKALKYITATFVCFILLEIIYQLTYSFSGVLASFSYSLFFIWLLVFVLLSKF